MSEALLPKRFLFRFSLPCWYRDPLWKNDAVGLDARHRLIRLAELEHPASPIDVRAAWSEAGLAFTVVVEGKDQAPWCRESRAEDSDGVHFWIDTRDVHNIHRASRFCHQFSFLPTGGGHRLDKPVGLQTPINRAKDQPRQVRPEELRVASQLKRNGYVLDVFLPAATLTGFDPAEHPRLGFTYAVVDRELGEHTLSVGSPMPYQEDPSFWATLDLTR
jgi:hypothetical protein